MAANSSNPTKNDGLDFVYEDMDIDDDGNNSSDDDSDDASSTNTESSSASVVPDAPATASTPAVVVPIDPQAIGETWATVTSIRYTYRITKNPFQLGADVTFSYTDETQLAKIHVKQAGIVTIDANAVGPGAHEIMSGVPFTVHGRPYHFDDLRANDFERRNSRGGPHPPLEVLFEGPFLGRGAFGRLRLAKLGSETVCGKIIPRGGGQNLDQILKEIDMLKRVQGKQGFINLRGYSVTDRYIYIIMDYVKGCTLQAKLFDKSGKFVGLPERDIKPVIYQIARALLKLDSVGLTHRDIKPENIMLANEDLLEVKVADFGLSNVGHALTTFCGTPGFLAPEVDANPDRKYNSKVDIYALACTWHFSLCGTTGSLGMTDPKATTAGPKPTVATLSEQARMILKDLPEAQDLMVKMFAVDPEERLNVIELVGHPYFYDMFELFE